MCLIDHPKAFFTPLERTENRSMRTYIGYTGYIRPCEHGMTRKHDLEEFWPRLWENNAEPAKDLVWVLRECRHPSHAPALGHHLMNERAYRATYPCATLRWKEGAVLFHMAWVGHLQPPKDA